MITRTAIVRQIAILQAAVRLLPVGPGASKGWRLPASAWCSAILRCAAEPVPVAHHARGEPQCIGFFGFVGLFSAATKSVNFARVRRIRAADGLRPARYSVTRPSLGRLRIRARRPFRARAPGATLVETLPCLRQRRADGLPDVRGARRAEHRRKLPWRALHGWLFCQTMRAIVLRRASPVIAHQKPRLFKPC